MKKFYYYTPLFIQSLFFIFFLPLYKFFIHLEIRGKENIKYLTGPIILASNHTHEIDPTVIPLITHFLSSKLPIYSVIHPIDKYNNLDFGWRRHIYKEFFFKILGGYPIYPGSRDYEQSLQNHVTLLKNKKTVCIFPEGRCTTDGNLGKAHGGMGYLAYKTNATVVPLAINTFYGLSWRNFLLRRKKVIVTVLQPISSQDLINSFNPQISDFQKAGDLVLEKIRKVIKADNLVYKEVE